MTYDLVIAEKLPVCSSFIFCSISVRSSAVTGTRRTMPRFLFAMLSPPLVKGLGSSQQAAPDNGALRECGHTLYACCGVFLFPHTGISAKCQSHGAKKKRHELLFLMAFLQCQMNVIQESSRFSNRHR